MSLVGLVAFFVTVAPAAALKYRSDTQPLVDDDSNSLEVFCPTGNEVVGGGVSTTGNSLDLELSSTLPADLDLDDRFNDGWSGSAGNSSGTAATLRVDAICAATDRVRYRSADKPLPDLSAASLTVNCPAGTKVTGGGVNISGGNNSIEVSTTKPIDGADADSTPDDGWFGRGTNRSGNAETMEVFANCDRGSYTYRTSTRRLSDNSIGTDTARCAQGTRVTGGGVGLNRPSESDVFGIEVSDTFPRDLGGSTKVPTPDDGWGGGANNDDTGERLTMTTYAICD